MVGKDLYKIAAKHLGEGGSKARAYCGLPSGASWCNAYVCYIAKEGGVKALYFDGTKQTYCPNSIKWCEANLAQVPLYLAMPMDIIYFDWEPNGDPNHIGFVKARKDTASIYTHEGNTSGGIVDEKTRPAKYVIGIFRPHFKPTGLKKAKLTVDGQFDYQSIYMLQIALGIKANGILDKRTVKALQKKVKVTPDGAWGKKTSKAVQKMIGVKADGEFGINSVKGLQKWINNKVYPKETTKEVPKDVNPILDTPTTTVSTKCYEGEFPNLPIKVPTNYAEQLAKKAKEMSWERGTAEKKWKYKTGSPNDACKKAMKKRGYKSKVALSDCGYFQNSIIYAVLGIKVKTLGAVTKAFKKVKKFRIVHKGKMGTFKLKAGDIIRYKKKHGQHVVMYVGNGVIAEAGRKTRFGRRIKSDKWNDGNVKKQSIQVLRVIEGTVSKNSLSKGDEGTEVKRLQKFLNWAGYNCGTATGKFNEKVGTAVRNFQYYNGLTVNGVFDKKCLAKAKTIER